jgi:hypothetical protein
VSQEQISTFVKVSRQPLEKSLLGFPVKVDDHVPAEDGVETGVDRPGLLNKVHAPERDQVADFRTYAHEPGVGAGAAQEVFVLERGRYSVQALLGIGPGLALLENLGVHVRGQDP